MIAAMHYKAIHMTARSPCRTVAGFTFMWVIVGSHRAAVLGDLNCEVILAMPYITILLLARTTYCAATGLRSICG